MPRVNDRKLIIRIEGAGVVTRKLLNTALRGAGIAAPVSFSGNGPEFWVDVEGQFTKETCRKAMRAFIRVCACQAHIVLMLTNDDDIKFLRLEYPGGTTMDSFDEEAGGEFLSTAAGFPEGRLRRPIVRHLKDWR